MKTTSSKQKVGNRSDNQNRREKPEKRKTKKFTPIRSTHEEGGTISPFEKTSRSKISSREIATPTTAGRQVATATSNPWEIYGNAATSRRFVGDLLKFSKGTYVAGSDGYEVEIGTELAVVMDSLITGWVKWRDGTVIDERVGPILDFQPPSRNELGDNDATTWPLDDEGQPRDPWLFTNRVVMVECDTETLYTFTCSSRGGLSAIGELAKVYGRRLHLHPDDYPVIKLGVGSYAHRVKSYGRIKYPIFEVIDWTPRGPLQALLNSNQDDR
jgi:hypothetical protein